MTKKYSETLYLLMAQTASQQKLRKFITYENDKMKLLSIFVLFFILTSQLHSQVITGKVVDSSNGEPLEYVGVGVINTSIGTITDEKGNFKIDVNGQTQKAIVRVSMISYKPQSFTIGELSEKDNTIRLVIAPTQLAEVIIKPSGKTRQAGTTSYSRIGNWCGWGGSHNGKGCEIGTKIALGNSPVLLKSLHIHVQRQAFDSSQYRLHIRTIANDEPVDELLAANIMITITKESGWIDIDLSNYNIVLQRDIALTLEWVKVFGINTNRAMKINNKRVAEYVLFNSKRNQGCTFMRWGTEAKWAKTDNGSPAFYLSIQE